MKRSFCGFAAAFLMLTVGASAQVSTKRHVDVTVTDPLHRFVTHLEQGSFDVLENGVRRDVTGFSDSGSPISIAIVSAEAPPAISGLGPQDEVLQAASVSDALRRLAASKNSRKVLVTLAPTDLRAIPAGIQTLQTNPQALIKWVIELRNQYRLEFESSTPSASVEVVFRQPVGLAPLKLSWQ